MNGMCVYKERNWNGKRKFITHFAVNCLLLLAYKMLLWNLKLTTYHLVCVFLIFYFLLFAFCDRVNNLICISMEADDVNTVGWYQITRNRREKLCDLSQVVNASKFDEKSTWQCSYRDIKSHNLLELEMTRLIWIANEFWTFPIRDLRGLSTENFICINW